MNDDVTADDWSEFVSKLSIRTNNIFDSNAIDSFDRLLSLSAAELLDLRNFGRRSLAEVRQRLAVRGQTLRGDPSRYVDQRRRLDECLSELTRHGCVRDEDRAYLLEELHRAALYEEPEWPVESSADDPKPEQEVPFEFPAGTILDPRLSDHAIREILDCVGCDDLLSMSVIGPVDVDVRTGFQAGPLAGAGVNYIVRCELGTWRIVSGERWIS